MVAPSSWGDVRLGRRKILAGTPPENPKARGRLERPRADNKEVAYEQGRKISCSGSLRHRLRLEDNGRDRLSGLNPATFQVAGGSAYTAPGLLHIDSLCCLQGQSQGRVHRRVTTDFSSARGSLARLRPVVIARCDHGNGDHENTWRNGHLPVYNQGRS